MRWLARQPPARTIAQLQHQVDRFIAYYNDVRPHRAVGRRPPIVAFGARDKARPSGPKIRVGAGVRVRRDRIDKNGKVTLRHRTRRLRDRLDALGPAPRAELLHVLMLSDFERADRIGEFWGYPESRAFAELLIDCEEDRTLRAALVGMLRERG